MPRPLHEISRELSALAQTGLTYSREPYDRERYERLNQIASELLRTDPRHAEFAWPIEDGYVTPKIDVRGLVIRGGEILMVREKSSGCWSVPGGWAEVNLTPAENVRKECLEEAGLVVTVDRLVSVLDRERAGHRPVAWSVYKLYFLCTPPDEAEPLAGPEIIEARYFPREALPPDLDHDRVSVEEIERGFRFREDPALTAFFQPL